jgi:hypothetical protein
MIDEGFWRIGDRILYRDSDGDLFLLQLGFHLPECPDLDVTEPNAVFVDRLVPHRLAALTPGEAFRQFFSDDDLPSELVRQAKAAAWPEEDD